ncbi:SPOR domain-containing protein [Reinekea sp.]|uniref:SPOR domain-containing protein n=1 Tax=Reinekea sp. TaxID=1970455 RepID=UPI002A83013D|nr:SPOR domain-containing protein [Reinekea sp.]
MARDFAQKPKAAPGSSTPRWVWIFTTSIALGFVAFLYFLSAVPADKGRAEAVRKQLAIALREPVAAPIQTTPKHESLEDIKVKAETLKQAFEFYQLLENDEVSIDLPGDQIDAAEPSLPAVSAVSPASQNSANTVAPAVIPDAGSWIIQVASFSQVADADRLRARLILSGLPNTEIQSVDVTGKGTFHRVMVGPFEHRPSLNKAQDTLANLDYQVLVKTQ